MDQYTQSKITHGKDTLVTQEALGGGAGLDLLLLIQVTIIKNLNCS